VFLSILEFPRCFKRAFFKQNKRFKSDDVFLMLPASTLLVGTSHDPVSQPVSEKPARKAPKQGRGSWIVPNIISPK
jgi:hypothetical protein